MKQTNRSCKIRLYAGTPEYPTLLAKSDQHSAFSSENALGAGNQQERPDIQLQIAK
jgi:hypothetical protein